jgi:hypothetical protein
MVFPALTAAVFALSLSGFGVDANPSAPTGAEIVKYAPGNTDAVLHIDFQAVVPNNFAAFQKLAKDKALAALPDLRKGLARAAFAAQAAVGSMHATLGVDVLRDVHSMSAFLVVPSRKDPSFVAVLRGSFGKDIIDKLGSIVPDQGRLTVAGLPALTRDGLLLVRAKDGSILLGTDKLIRARVAPTWKPPRLGSSSNLARLARIADREKPFALVASTLSARASQRIQRQLAMGNFGRDLLKGHRFAAFFLTHRGVGWDVVARTNRGLQRIAQGSRGVVQLFRASQFGGRGLANIMFATVESFTDRSDQLAALVRHKKKLLEVADAYSGDGTFSGTTTVDKRTKTVSVRAMGKHLSHVVPAVGIVPLLAAGYFATRPKTVKPPPSKKPPRKKSKP